MCKITELKFPVAFQHLLCSAQADFVTVVYVNSCT